MDGFSFQSVKTALVRSGAVLQLPDLLSERGLSRPLFVTDAMLIELGVVTPIIDHLRDSCDSVSVFEGIEPDPSERVVGACLAAFRAGDCDSLIAVGGGSSMDVAKVVSYWQMINKLYRKSMGWGWYPVHESPCSWYQQRLEQGLRSHRLRLLPPVKRQRRA